MKDIKFNFRRFFEGFASASCIVPLPFTIYPFPFAGKALSFDWDSAGKDIFGTINKVEEAKNERK